MQQIRRIMATITSHVRFFFNSAALQRFDFATRTARLGVAVGLGDLDARSGMTPACSREVGVPRWLIRVINRLSLKKF
jgi:hypothetical protein